MEDHEYCESNICESYVYSQEISNEQENIAIEKKNGDAFLIKLYRERPFLYNKRHNDFKDRIIKDNAWNEMSKIMLNKNYGKLQMLFFLIIYFLSHFIANLYDG